MNPLYFLLLPLFVFSQKNYPVLLDSFMKAQETVRSFNGNVLVAKAGKIVYQQSFGYRNYATGELLDSNSVFELASVSKQFTAMGILLLKEKGKLKLSDSLRKFFPELPYTNITIRQLLTHTSGVPDYEQAMRENGDHNKVAFNGDVISYLKDHKIPINFKPGAKWEYSNTGYVMLASVIEKVSGQSFKEYMDANIFKRLHMDRSRIYNTRRSANEVIPGYAYGFVYSDSLQRYILPDSLSEFDFVRYLDGIQGDGTVNSTCGDLLKWDRALKNHTLLSAATQKEMLSPQATEDTLSKVYYGYGVAISRNELGNYIMHSGGWPGYATALFRYPDDDLTIVVLSNNESRAPVIAKAMAYIMKDLPVVWSYHHRAIAIDSSLINKYTGTYSIQRADATLKLEFFKADGRLMYRNENDPAAKELIPESENKFFTNDDMDMQFEFAQSAAEKSYFIFSGMKREMKKRNKKE